MTVDDRFNSLEIVGEEKFVLSFGIRRRLKTIQVGFATIHQLGR